MYGVIIVAAGIGQRFESKTPKQFLPLNGVPVFLRSVKTFKRIPRVKQIVLVTAIPYLSKAKKYAKKYGFTVVKGGKKRQDSVKAGLAALDPKMSYVAIHDAARPLIDVQSILKAFESAHRSGAAIVAVPAHDTVKLVSKNGAIARTIPRETVFLAQTPQVFRVSLIKNAYNKLKNRTVTDDAQVMELAKHRVSIVTGSYKNLKITERDDLKIAKIILKKNRG